MRLPTPPSETIIQLAAPFASFFSGVDWSYFIAFMTMLCEGMGRRTVTQAQRMASFERDYSRHSRFLDTPDFDEEDFQDTKMDELRGAGWTTELGDGRRIVVTATDDTLARRPWGPELVGTELHHDDAAASHQSNFCEGQRYVVFGVIPDALNQDGARCTMADLELYRSRDEVEEEEFQTKLELGASMTQRLRGHLDRRGAEETVTLDLVDAWYLKSPYLKAVRSQPNSHVLGRVQINRVFYEMPGSKPEGKPGPAASKGPQWDWREALREEGTEVTQHHYGTEQDVRYVAREVKINNFEDSVLAIAVQYANHPDDEPVLLLTTLTDLDAEEAIRLYTARFSLEESIRDMKYKLGFGTEMVRTPQRWKSYKRYMLLAHQWMRRLADGASEELCEEVRDPWRDEESRLTVGLVQQALRYESFGGERIFEDLGDPPRSGEIEALYDRATTPRSSRGRKTGG